MRQDLPEEPTGSDRQKDCHLQPNTQARLDLVDPQENADKIADTYEILRKAVTIFGGRERLALELGRDLDYAAKISNGLNRRDDRHAFVDYLIPLMRHAEAGALVVEWFCALGGFERPKRRPVATTEEKLDSLLRVLQDAGVAGDDLVKRAAQRLGVDIGSFKR